MGWTMPKFITQSYHKYEGTYLLLGRSPNQKQKNRIKKQFKKDKVTERRSRSGNIRRGRREKGARRPEGNQARNNAEGNSYVEATKKLADLPADHACSVRFVSAPAQYIETQQKKNGSKVPFLYETSLKRGYPATVQHLKDAIINVNKIARISVTA